MPSFQKDKKSKTHLNKQKNGPYEYKKLEKIAPSILNKNT